MATSLLQLHVLGRVPAGRDGFKSRGMESPAQLLHCRHAADFQRSQQISRQSPFPLVVAMATPTQETANSRLAVVETTSLPSKFGRLTPLPYGVQQKALKFGSILAGTTAIAMGLGVAFNVLERMETLPLIPQVETMLGALVTSKFAAQFFMGGEGRARLESFFEDILDRLSGTHGFSDLEGLEPSMLDVQLRSVVDEHLARGNGSEAVVHKQSLVSALKSFIVDREMKARRVNTVLRTDLETANTDRITLRKELDVALDASRSAAAAAKAEIVELTSFSTQLQAELDDARVMIVELSASGDRLTDQIRSLTTDRTHMQRLNDELRSRVSSLLAENTTVAQRAQLLEQANLVGAQKFAQMQADQSAALLQLQEEKSQALAELEAQSARMEGSLEQMRAERMHFLSVSDDLERKLDQASMERQEGRTVIAHLEEALELAQTAEKQAASHVAELRLYLKQQQHSSSLSASNDLHQQSELSSLRKALEVAEARAVAAGAHAQEATVMAREALSKATALNVSESAGEAAAVAAEAVVLPAVEVAAAALPREEVVAPVVKSESVTAPMTKAETASAPKATTVNLAFYTANASASDEGLSAAAKRKIQSHARAIRDTYIDINKSFSEQPEGIDQLAKELVKVGAPSYHWATGYIKRSMAYEKKKNVRGITKGRTTMM